VQSPVVQICSRNEVSASGPAPFSNKAESIELRTPVEEGKIDIYFLYIVRLNPSKPRLSNILNKY